MCMCFWAYNKNIPWCRREFALVATAAPWSIDSVCMDTWKHRSIYVYIYI